MSNKLEPILVVPDVHRPYHDKRAWKLMMKVAKEFKPVHLYTIGDYLDFYSVSDHSKDPLRALQLDKEIKDGAEGLDELDALKPKYKTYLGGNHEWRLQRYLQNKAPELFPILKVEELLKLKQRGWTYVPYKEDTKIGKVYLTHDVGYAGRHAVTQSLDAYQHSIITGHSHRFSYIVEGNAVGEHKLSAQFGWLGDAKQVDYMHRAKVNKNWALGFGIGYVNPATKIVYMQPVPLIKYTAVVNGKLYSG